MWKYRNKQTLKERKMDRLNRWKETYDNEWEQLKYLLELTRATESKATQLLSINGLIIVLSIYYLYDMLIHLEDKIPTQIQYLFAALYVIQIFFLILSILNAYKCFKSSHIRIPFLFNEYSTEEEGCKLYKRRLEEMKLTQYEFIELQEKNIVYLEKAGTYLICAVSIIVVFSISIIISHFMWDDASIVVTIIRQFIY